MKQIVLLLGLISVLSGCGKYDGWPEPEPYQYGRVPDVPRAIKQANAQSIVRPRFVVNKVVKCYLRDTPVRGGTILAYGWCINAVVSVYDQYANLRGWENQRIFVGPEFQSIQFYGQPAFPEVWYNIEW